MKKKVNMQLVKMLSFAATASLMVMILFSCGREGSTQSLTGVTPSKVQQVDCNTATVAEIVTMHTDSLDRKKEFFFPDTVTIKTNEIVKWVNTDDNNWWVESDAETVPSDKSFYSGPFAPGKSYCLQFTVAGTFNYHCNELAGVTGVVYVQ
jgi:plastocyanin